MTAPSPQDNQDSELREAILEDLKASDLDRHLFRDAAKHRDITVDAILRTLATQKTTWQIEARKASYEKVHAIHMAHDWNETSQDLKDYLTAELHDIQRLQAAQKESKG